MQAIYKIETNPTDATHELLLLQLVDVFLRGQVISNLPRFDIFINKKAFSVMNM